MYSLSLSSPPLSLSLSLSLSLRGGVTQQGVVLTDLQSLLDCQYKLFSLSLYLTFIHLLVPRPSNTLLQHYRHRPYIPCYICICMYVCMCVCMHVCVCVCVCVFVHILSDRSLGKMTGQMRCVIWGGGERERPGVCPPCMVEGEGEGDARRSLACKSDLVFRRDHCVPVCMYT
jgi:hypothetical protein